MAKLWKVKEKINEEAKKKLNAFHPLIAQLLFNREIKESEKAQNFLNTEYKGLNSPFLFLDMQKAVERIWQAIDENQKVTIYGDYDADAITANAVLRQTFNYLKYDNVESYIPDRFSEGYGVNIDALSIIKDKGSKIIITVDCGTNSTEAAMWCKQNNIDFIITDHHEITGDLPESYALVNPKNSEDVYPEQNITGVGVAFKMAQAILSDEKKVNKHLNRVAPTGASGQPRTFMHGWSKWLLDLVAIGTVADCHSLIGENRILVKYGLKVLAKTKWIGLKALCATAGLDFKNKLPDTYTLGFVIAPRLNAAGRLEHADIALDLLLENDQEKALGKALELGQINKRRQQLTERVVSEAREKAEIIRERKIIVLSEKDWPKGIVGLVAGRLAADLYKPVVILQEEGDEATGSGRSVGNFNILEAIKFASGHLLKFGGHSQAVGLTLKMNEFEKFYRKLLEFSNKNLEDEEKCLELEAELEEKDLSLEFLNLLFALEPFGVGNPKPKFLINNLKVSSKRLVGNGEKHLQINFSLRAGNQLNAIWFSAPEFAKNLKLGDAVDVAVELLEDSWNGSKKLKLRIIDAK